MNTLPNTAILIFANSSKEDCCRKSILHGENLFDSLTDYTIKKVERTGLPYFHFSEKDQVGANFGERFTHAIRSVFYKGFENIITIGNDTPQLKTSHLHVAIEALKNGKTVLGPSLDGGFYLLGIHKSEFNPYVFNQLPWQRFDLLNKISYFFKNSNCSVFNLPALQDLDTIKDVTRLNNFTHSISSRIRALFTTLIGIANGIINKVRLSVYTYFFQIPFNKGSPLSLVN
ncbi:TIGR04282 family arsenosugar biosynthesis glycosyltransferase [Maribacter sp. CXY002]|uniref:TIGR04282 family arsenosugar biosynthesis glycosyltransferase n=1 Tax=Maribacter luteocoastalis TaxID=3407671 RepID=UPI003B67264D